MENYLPALAQSSMTRCRRQALSVRSLCSGSSQQLSQGPLQGESVWSAKLKMSLVLRCYVAFHLPAVWSLSVTKICCARNHNIYQEDPAVFSQASHRTESLCFSFICEELCCCHGAFRGGGHKEYLKAKVRGARNVTPCTGDLLFRRH